jgi:hypothetical protein
MTNTSSFNPNNSSNKVKKSNSTALPDEELQSREKKEPASKSTGALKEPIEVTGKVVINESVVNEVAEGEDESLRATKIVTTAEERKIVEEDAYRTI